MSVSPQIRPLPQQLWFQEIRKLSQRACIEGQDVEFVLRSAFHLQNLAPTPLKRLLGEPVEESVYEPLLEKDLLSAALCLVETPVQKGGMPQLQAAFDEKASREMGKAEQQKLAKDVLLTWLLALLEFSTQLPSAPGRTRQ